MCVCALPLSALCEASSRSLAEWDGYLCGNNSVVDMALMHNLYLAAQLPRTVRRAIIPAALMLRIVRLLLGLIRASPLRLHPCVGSMIETLLEN